MNLKELHDLVKNHPYRQNEDIHFKESYIKAIDKLSDAFYYTIKETEYRLSNNMCHDMNYCTRHFDDPEHQHYLDLCIGVIHHFIDTGEVPYYYTYYDGVNHLDAMAEPLRRLEYDNERGKYRLVLSQETQDKCLAEIDNAREMYKRKFNKDVSDYGIYSESYKKWIKNAIIR